LAQETQESSSDLIGCTTRHQALANNRSQHDDDSDTRSSGSKLLGCQFKGIQTLVCWSPFMKGLGLQFVRKGIKGIQEFGLANITCLQASLKY
jgi:hypothetical protein